VRIHAPGGRRRGEDALLHRTDAEIRRCRLGTTPRFFPSTQRDRGLWDDPRPSHRQAAGASRDIAALAGARPHEDPEREVAPLERKRVLVVADEPIPISTEIEAAVLTLDHGHAAEPSWLQSQPT